ncbi:MAG: [FeFe] hydrogenase H-cluster radical SAM maturase HydE [Elusimicrobiales bacterium]
MKEKEIEDLIADKSFGTDIFDKADKIRKENFGDGVHLRALIEFSNYCSRNCLYCGLRRDNNKLKRYRMSSKEILSCAKKAFDMGFKTVVLQSGEDLFFKTKDLCAIVYKIKKNYGLRVTLSAGLLKKSDYGDLKNSGVDRYLLKFETSDKKLYEYLKPDSVFGDRLKAIEILKELNYQTGSGIMAGLPGQNDKILAKDLKLIKDMELDMVSVGPFISDPDTPLKNCSTIEEFKMIKILALTRILSPFSHMPATTSMGVLYKNGRKKALLAGANVLMPDITPVIYGENYRIYPGKNIKDPEDNINEIKDMLSSISRHISYEFGDSVRGGFYGKNS